MLNSIQDAMLSLMPLKQSYLSLSTVVPSVKGSPSTSLSRSWKKALAVLLLCYYGGHATAQQDSLRHSVGVSYEHTHFDKQFTDDWKVTSLEYSYKTTRVAYVGRVNYASRFGQQGVQLEAQAYPLISKRVYAYLGASYSNNSPVFPTYTTGATVYASLGKGWEVEGGYRQLHFNENIWVGSGGLSKYLGAWLVNFTSYLSINSPANNQSYFFTAKRFLSDRGDMVWFQAGSGVSPDERRNVQLSTGQLTSKRLTAGTRFFTTKRTLAQITAGYSRDEYREKTYGNQWYGSAGMAFLF